jgi:PhnB protein
MLHNRSAPHARVVPVLTVVDVRAAIDWYGKVLGFVEHVRIGDGHRAQLGLPGESVAELIVAEVRPERRAPGNGRSHQVMVKVEDASAMVERARQHGATIASELRDFEYGERQAAFDDPFGHQWVVTETRVDTAPESWGGATIVPR